MRLSVFFIVLLFPVLLIAQDATSFMIYNNQGKKVSVKKFFKELNKGDVILFGELHNNPICHWMQLKVAKSLLQKGELIIGAEMFESDQQEVLNQYLSREINQEAMDSAIRLWPNYATDYKPLVDFALINEIPFIATNTPQKHASFVYRNGLEELEKELTEEEKKHLAPLPIAYDPNLPGYHYMKTMMDSHDSQLSNNLPKAQAIKDATMAHFISEAYLSTVLTFLHINGDYHSKDYEGIYWYLKRLLGDSANIITISSVEQSNPMRFEEEHKGRADFIIVIDEDMTKSY